MLKLYNTLTRKKELFKPIKKGFVGMYSCGPTVYDFAHIGNFRAYIAADLLKRYIRFKGFRVKHVMNITDVDDKTIKNSRKQGVSLKKFTDKYIKAFFEDIETLNIDKADVYPKATETIKEMVSLVKRLLEKGIAYKGDDGSIYYNISMFKEYGKLAGVKLKEMQAKSRISHDEYDKEDTQDFALWKAWDDEDGDVFWLTDIGKGRPGWHIECSAMSSKYLGKHFDIHTGGVDLIFPHHQNEIAQSEAANNCKFVNYWFHNEHLLVENKKMSKSLGNFYTLRDLLNKGYGPRAIRYVLLSTHYREKLNFTFTGLEAAKNGIERLDNFMFNLKHIQENKDNKKIMTLIKKVENNFEKAMDDDLNIANALAVIFDFIRDVNKEEISKKNAKEIIKFMKKIDSVLGLLKEEKEEKLDKNIEALIKKREFARKNKDYEKADKIRAELKEKGIILEDTKKGVVWKKI
jgi:cysteinyl-tRNA synthetase